MWPFPRRAEPEVHERTAPFNFGDVFGAPNTSAGMAVTSGPAPRLAAVWRCLTLLCDTISTLPIDVFRDGSKEPVDKPRILVRPSADATFDEWIWELLWQALTSPAAWGLITDRSGPALRPARLNRSAGTASR